MPIWMWLWMFVFAAGCSVWNQVWKQFLVPLQSCLYPVCKRFTTTAIMQCSIKSGTDEEPSRLSRPARNWNIYFYMFWSVIFGPKPKTLLSTIVWKWWYEYQQRFWENGKPKKQIGDTKMENSYEKSHHSKMKMRIWM